MAAKKKGEEYNIKSDKAPTAKEIAEVTKRINEIASGKKEGAIIVIEKIEEGGRTGIKGFTYWRGMNTLERIQTMQSVVSVPAHMLQIILAMTAKQD